MFARDTANVRTARGKRVSVHTYVPGNQNTRTAPFFDVLCGQNRWFLASLRNNRATLPGCARRSELYCCRLKSQVEGDCWLFTFLTKHNTTISSTARVRVHWVRLLRMRYFHHSERRGYSQAFQISPSLATLSSAANHAQHLACTSQRSIKLV